MSEPAESEPSILDVVTTEEPLKFEAEYELERPARCPSCQKLITKVGVIRLIRTRVNFVSTFPRRGYLAVCGECSSILPADLAGLI